MNEDKLVGVAKPYFDKCRSGDWNHALRVVKWIKVLGEERSDLDLLIVAAYLHDIGWSGVLKEGKVNFDEMLKFEDEANKNTSTFVREVLDKLDFSEEDIKIVIRLIDAADRYESRAEDEEIIVDADSLSKLCVEHVKEKYSENSYKKVVDLWSREFPERVKTEKARELFPKLLEKLKEDLFG